MSLQSMGAAAGLSADQVLLLKYSRVEERESNNGRLRLSGGIGAAFMPLLTSVCSLLADFWLSFAVVSAIMLVFTPLLHYKLLRVDNFFTPTDIPDDQTPLLAQTGEEDNPKAKREPTAADLLRSRYTVFALASWLMLTWSLASDAAMIMELLIDVHGVDRDLSTLVFLYARAGFTCGTFLTLFLYKGGIMSRI